VDEFDHGPAIRPWRQPVIGFVEVPSRPCPAGRRAAVSMRVGILFKTGSFLKRLTGKENYTKYGF
jgi:hypothetical protein